MNVSGHRISTTEVESALVSHPAVAEAAVVGANDATTGQAIIAYVTLRGGHDGRRRRCCATTSATEIGAIAKPKTIYFTPDLPKTRSGKIMRRLLRDVAEGRNLGDTTTLADASVVDELQRRAAEMPPRTDAVARGRWADLSLLDGTSRHGDSRPTSAISHVVELQRDPQVGALQQRRSPPAGRRASCR